MNLKAERIQKLDNFRSLCLNTGLKEVAPHVYELDHKKSKTLTCSAIIHGNEIGGFEVLFEIVKLINEKKIQLKSNLRLILGNIPAYLEDKRFIEKDLNRSFALDTPSTQEEIRAKGLEKFLLATDIFIDFHQTIGPTDSGFFIFEFSEQSYALARHLNETLPIVTHCMKREFKGQTSTAFTKSAGVLGITLESGQKGIEDAQTAIGVEIAKKAMETDFEKPLRDVPISNTYTFHQILKNPEGRFELVQKYKNFDPIKRGDVLAKDASSELTAETDGVILFPKYGEYARTTPELALILRPVRTKEEI